MANVLQVVLSLVGGSHSPLLLLDIGLNSAGLEAIYKCSTTEADADSSILVLEGKIHGCVIFCLSSLRADPICCFFNLE